jgi:predicted regulator of Ras-like GTPase activity (Roadblock/LC7/MglB family)
MATLPQLIEEDIQRLDYELKNLLTHTDATTAIIIDKGGFLITSQGEATQFDLTTIAALASGAFMANQTIANLVHEESFDSVYQQGQKLSMFVMGIDEHCLLVVIFKATVSVGVVKYFSAPASAQIAKQLSVAQQRDPENGLDLSVLNIADTADLFRRKG